MEKVTSTLRVRMSYKDAHYGGNLVDGAHMVHLFGDVATELLIKMDGDEGLFLKYTDVEFLAPVYAGDYIEAYGEIYEVGNTSERCVSQRTKSSQQDMHIPSAADVLTNPSWSARPEGICVMPKDAKRNKANNPEYVVQPTQGEKSIA